MKNIGIVAEYNPFHNGHLHHLCEAKRQSGADNIIVVMSASFVQRGEPACADKFTRARWAIEGGADMVIELPDIISLCCAERFAYGSIRLLVGCGIVDGICFGSESGDVSVLKTAAMHKPGGIALKNALKSGVPYPKAASIQLQSLGINTDLSTPNDTLAIEYLRALSKLAPQLEVHTVKRIGGAYNSSALDGSISSATAIRSRLTGGLTDEVRCSVPEYVFSDMVAQSKAGLFPANQDALSDSILYALRKLGSDGLSAIADVSEGLENPIAKAALQASNYSELLSMVKTKRYTLARLKRICMNALLGITAQAQDEAVLNSDSAFIHVLGVRKEKAFLLSELSAHAEFPIVSAYSDYKKLCPAAQTVGQLSRFASNVRALACPTVKTAIDDFSQPLIMV